MHGQRRQVRGLTGTQGAVKRRELAQQHSHRPPVDHDVVQGEEQHRLPATEAHQGGSHQGTRRQIERARRRLGSQPAHHPTASVLPQGGEVDHCGGEGPPGFEHLMGAAAACREATAQDFVAAHDLPQGGEQLCRPHGAVEGPGDRHVVGSAAGCQAIEKPQALLGERQGRLRRTFPGDQRR